MSVCVYVVCVVHLSMVAYFFIKTLTLTFKYSKIVFICVCVFVWACMPQCASGGERTTFGSQIFLPTCGFRGLNSGGQAWLPSAYTCWPISSWPFKWKLFNETPEGSFTVYFLDFIWTGLFQRSPNMFQFSYFSDASFWLNRNKKFFFFFQAACVCGERLWQLDHKSNSSTWQSEWPAKWRSAPACRLVKPKDNSVAEISRERVAGQSKPQYKINIPTWLMFHGWFLFASESLKLIYESDWGHPFFLCSICYLYRVTVTFLNCQRVPVQTPPPNTLCILR